MLFLVSFAGLSSLEEPICVELIDVLSTFSISGSFYESEANSLMEHPFIKFSE